MLISSACKECGNCVKPPAYAAAAFLGSPSAKTMLQHGKIAFCRVSQHRAVGMSCSPVFALLKRVKARNGKNRKDRIGRSQSEHRGLSYFFHGSAVHTFILYCL